MPDAARPKLRSPSDLSRGIVETPVLTSSTIIDTSSMVHLRSSPHFIPDRGSPAVSHDAHHGRSLRPQLRVVWCLLLIGDTEGPIPHHWCNMARPHPAASPSWHTDNYADTGGFGGIYEIHEFVFPWVPSKMRITEI
jgi:hypothetical protein